MTAFLFLGGEKSTASPHFSPPKTKTNIIPNGAKWNEESQILTFK